MRKIVTIDGPSGVGKGTVAQALARRHGWAYLDSGAVYRLAALFLKRQNLSLAATATQVAALQEMAVDFVMTETVVRVFLNGVAIDDVLRREETGALASQLAVKPEIRAALLDFQRNFAGDAPLIADGRDMGTVVFPEAPLKIFLDATAEIRAERRYKQLIEKGEDVTLAALKKEIAARDARDRNRLVAPLKPASDAVLIDTTDLSVQAVLEKIDALWQAHFFNF
ncbi:(d)CMP kinase [Dichelobacter nodosus]|uniref:Cytidylate kinase n=1 Tax=Dichelobacter nodosus (strain VCS1703A) TaxID=246195 RepID=KCY_DICNV|nr:(d)CMP kinase [Dichelobacter nodosus]A5EWQ0.1 RecName: Full=Cytidylate kinase; Short=CK; AltName: Full=Cytidine monophosphate kinase; Short=CMP kinase [Dichelobacter nodosus VCS1703A]ABQ14130.1 cytidylate kinase [Dichelobacter nodosus VCS1703A]